LIWGGRDYGCVKGLERRKIREKMKRRRKVRLPRSARTIFFHLGNLSGGGPRGENGKRDGKDKGNLLVFGAGLQDTTAGKKNERGQGERGAA